MLGFIPLTDTIEIRKTITDEWGVLTVDDSISKYYRVHIDYATEMKSISNGQGTEKVITGKVAFIGNAPITETDILVIDNKEYEIIKLLPIRDLSGKVVYKVVTF